MAIFSLRYTAWLPGALQIASLGSSAVIFEWATAQAVGRVSALALRAHGALLSRLRFLPFLLAAPPRESGCVNLSALLSGLALSLPHLCPVRSRNGLSHAPPVGHGPKNSAAPAWIPACLCRAPPLHTFAQVILVLGPSSRTPLTDISDPPHSFSFKGTFGLFFGQAGEYARPVRNISTCSSQQWCWASWLLASGVRSGEQRLGQSRFAVFELTGDLSSQQRWP